MSRGDDLGFFWDDRPVERSRAAQRPRALPPVPDTGWHMPEEFPDLSHHGMIGLDIETYDPELRSKGPGVRRDGYIAGVSVATQKGFCAYYPIGHKDGPNLPSHVVLGWLSDELSREGQPKVGANLLYDLDYLTHAGVQVAGPFYDVQVAEPLLDENRLTYGLESLAQKYLDEGKVEDEMSNWLEVAFGKSNIKSNIWRAPPAVVGPYAEGDASLPLRIFEQQAKLLEEAGLWDLFQLETKLIPLLLRMRQRGVPVDLPGSEQLRDQLEQREREEVARIKELSGVGVDIWAADSLARAFDRLGLEYPRTEKTGKPSFKAEWLEHHSHPVAQHVRNARRMQKYRGTFVEGYVLEGHVNGRIHTTFNQLRGDDSGTVSGRFSSSNPNLQNIPKRDKEWGKTIRGIFIPEEGQTWWSVDWSQVEYRIICHYAALMNIPGVEEAVRRYREDADTDYHQVIADITGLDRSSAKNLNFGLAYGQGVDLLCKNLGVDRATGEAIIADYHQRAPFLRVLSQQMTNAASRRGYIKTWLGRYRRFDAWEKDGRVTRQQVPGARRAFTHKALNACIQGSAADVMKKAMVDINESGVLDVLGVPHLTVHDELDGSYDPGRPDHVEAFKELVHIMESCVQLKVPLRADVSFGKNWGEA